MIASDHTHAMLSWWAATGVDRIDLAVRRPTGAMLWQRDRAIDALPIAWVRAENVQHADVYIRPARGHAWPLVFVDDVGVDRAQALARELDALLVETSPAGGCHVWLHCDRVLAEQDRMRAQRGWIVTLGADPGSVSGEHLGRLAGFKNWKRGGCWVNVLATAHGGRPWTVIDHLTTPPRPPTSPTRPRGRDGLWDTTPSGQDWAWACTRLEHGHAPDTIYAPLVDRLVHAADPTPSAMPGVPPITRCSTSPATETALPTAPNAERALHAPHRGGDHDHPRRTDACIRPSGGSARH